jgi:mgtE-like transporter
MLQFPRRVRARFVALLRADASGVRAGFFALLISSFGDLVAGLTLGSITGTLDRLPGLLVLVPAAIGMRGNVFGALGSRLGTMIHAGTFRVSNRIETQVGQNAAAAFALSLSVSVVLAILAKTLSAAFGLAHTISMVDFFVVSVIGALLASIVVLVITVAVAAFCARRELDLDNVAAPIVTAAGDVITLPSLFLATYLLGIPFLTPLVALAAIALGLGCLIAALRSGQPILRRIVIESFPILILAGAVDVLAGLTIENRFESFLTYPALLVLVPPFLEDSGSLGGILAARLSTKLHLGTLEPSRAPWRAAPEDFLLVFVYAVPVFLLLGLSADLASWIAGLSSPGPLQMVGVSMLGGFFATTAAAFVGYYAAVATHRLGLDPDNHGIPIVTSSLDLFGALALILAIVMLGIR